MVTMQSTPIARMGERAKRSVVVIVRPLKEPG
jgi:hypothetical protein